MSHNNPVRESLVTGKKGLLMNFDRETVDAILLGQDNLDQMRAQTNKLIGMLIGMVDCCQRGKFLENNPRAGLGKLASEPLETEDGAICFWRIWVSEDGLEVYFLLKEGLLDFQKMKLSPSESRWRAPEHVELIYGRLPKLLELFVQTFPHLEDRLQPYLNAADVQL